MAPDEAPVTPDLAAWEASGLAGMSESSIASIARKFGYLAGFAAGRGSTADRVAALEAVWAVIFSNYEPAEVAAIYGNEAAASKHAEALGGDWAVVRWTVQSEYTDDPLASLDRIERGNRA